MTDPQTITTAVDLVAAGRQRHPHLAHRMEQALVIVLFRTIAPDPTAGDA